MKKRLVAAAALTIAVAGVARLTVKRRAYEYDHEYGFKLVGRTVSSDIP